MTQAEYAKHRGVSAVAVHKAVKAGRISLIGDKIDPEVADIQWAKNTRARQRPDGAAPAPSPIEAAASAPGDSGQAPPPAQPDTGYTAARARREVAEAEQAEIELRRKKGELVLREDVDRAFREIMREVRDRLMATAKRTAAEVSSLTSAADCEEVIEREHRIVLELLVQSFREKVGAPPEARG
jgi:hypothetical protein